MFISALCFAVPFCVSVEACDDDYLRGDSNGDGVIDIADPVFTLFYLFLGEKAPECTGKADINNDLMVDVSDSVYTLNYLFKGGPEPVGGLAGKGDDNFRINLRMF